MSGGLTKAPLRWLQEASAEEIGEALLAVGVEKAGAVVLYVGHRVGPELAQALDVALEKAQENPAETLKRVGFGALNSLLGGDHRR
jgi:hypothetical protein